MRELQQQWYSIILDDLFLWNRIYNPKGYQSKCFWSRISLKERNNITPVFVLKMWRNIITSKFSMKELPIYHSWKVLYASTELFKWSSWSNISYGYMIIYFCSIDRYIGHTWKKWENKKTSKFFWRFSNINHLFLCSNTPRYWKDYEDKNEWW